MSTFVGHFVSSPREKEKGTEELVAEKKERIRRGCEKKQMTAQKHKKHLYAP